MARAVCGVGVNNSVGCLSLSSQASVDIKEEGKEEQSKTTESMKDELEAQLHGWCCGPALTVFAHRVCQRQDFNEHLGALDGRFILWLKDCGKAVNSERGIDSEKLE